MGNIKSDLLNQSLKYETCQAKKPNSIMEECSSSKILIEKYENYYLIKQDLCHDDLCSNSFYAIIQIAFDNVHTFPIKGHF